MTHNQFKLNHSSFIIPIVALAGLGTLSVLAINQDTSYNASAADSVAINSEVSYGDYYLSLTNSATGGLNLNVDTTASGTYAYTSDNVTVKTNATNGYKLYLTSGDSNSAALKLNGTETGVNKVINPSTATGGATGNTAVLAANTYGYAVPSEKIGNNNFDSSYANPTAGSKWAGIQTSTTNGLIHSTSTQNETGDVTEVHYGVYANNALVAGSYTGTVVYTAVAEMPSSVAASINPTSGSAGSTVTVTSGPLIANTATLANSDVSITIGDSACTVTNVNATNGYLQTTCTTSSSLAAGAKDVVISVPRYNYSTTITGGYTVIIPTLKQAANAARITTMQGLTRAVCGKASIYKAGETDLTLKDSRDNNTYVIRKLADGNCWMVQNLRLTRDTLTAAGNTTGALTTNDTNITANTTLPAVNEAFCTTGYLDCHNALNHMGSGNTEYGAYYSWAAATLDSEAYSKGSDDIAETSVCPKSGDSTNANTTNSWHLPTGNTNGEWYNMMTKYTDGVSNFTAGSGNARTDFTDATITGVNNKYGSNYAPNLPFSGYRYGSSTYYSGEDGYFWSSTAHTGTTAYHMDVRSNSVVCAGARNAYKKNGYSVRCVLTSSS